MKPESKFYQRLVMKFNDCDFNRIEPFASYGIPDVTSCYQGHDCWIELKCVTAGRTLLRPDQHAWGHRRAHHGGNVVILSLHPSDDIFCFKFPDLRCEPYGKYLSVLGDIKKIIPMSAAPIVLKTFLYPGITI